MKTPLKIHIFVLLTTIAILSACGEGTEQSASAPPTRQGGYAATQAPQAMPTPAALVQKAEADQGKVEGEMAAAAAAINPGNRMIIKDAQIRLLVADTEIAIDRATQVISDVGGYIISSRVWYQDWLGQNYKYSTITIGVPVDQFERTLSRLRGLSIRVLDESATGEDVTDQYVDLESQLRNLEATRDRIRSFLDQAQTVEEALKVNEQLTEIERQVEQIKGRMNYLENRAAYSTITITIEPQLPDIPTPTITPTHTPTPTPTPAVWKPGETFDDASEALVNAYHWLIELVIWILVAFLPIVLPPVLVIWLVWRLITRRHKKSSSGGQSKV